MFQLQETYFEGVAAKILIAYTGVLEEEYGTRSTEVTAYVHNLIDADV